VWIETRRTGFKTPYVRLEEFQMINVIILTSHIRLITRASFLDRKGRRQFAFTGTLDLNVTTDRAVLQKVWNATRFGRRVGFSVLVG
jgi:hypothetical protein